MATKIKLTEEQLKKVVATLEEQEFDSMITNYNKARESEGQMSHDDARMLASFALKFCEGKEHNPDCKHVHQIWSKHQLFM